MIRKPAFQIDQIAYASRSDQETQRIKERFGFLHPMRWVEDTVVAEGTVNGIYAQNTAKLFFHYDMGIELEILQYVDGPNYVSESNIKSGELCHISAHMNKPFAPESLDAQEWLQKFDVYQQVITKSHTNQYLIDNGRHYRYTIYDTRAELGHFFKVIERLENHNG